MSTDAKQAKKGRKRAKAGPTKNFLYGAYPPRDHSQLLLADEQMRGGHRYRNSRCEMELERRKRVNEFIRQYEPRLHELEARQEEITAQVEELRTALKARRKSERKRIAASDEMRAKLDGLNAQLKPLRAEFKSLRTAVYQAPQVKEKMEEIRQWYVAEGKARRKASGLHWGTYLFVERSCESFTKGPPPKFLSYRGEGAMAVQCHLGATLEELMEGHPQVRLEGIDENAIRYGSRSVRRRAAKNVVLRLRVGSERVAIGGGKTKRGQGIWISIPFRMHRIWPAGAKVKWVYVFRRKVATRFYWSVMFSVSRDEGFRPGDVASRGVCGVDLGYRLIGGDLRVAMIAGRDHDPAYPFRVSRSLEGSVRLHEKGTMIEVSLPARYVSGHRKVDDLQSIRDKNFNEVKERLLAWKEEQKELPEHLAKELETLHAWRSQPRLAATVLRWRVGLVTATVPGEEPPPAWPILPEWLEAWRKQDKHLYEWKENMRQKLIRRRLDLYRCLAAELRKHFGTVQLEATNWRDMLSKAPTEEEDEQTKTNRYYGRIASPGTLAQVLKECGMVPQQVNPKNTTKTCRFCGHVNNFDQRLDLTTVCSSCGESDDQDRRAATNICRAEPVKDPKSDKKNEAA